MNQHKVILEVTYYSKANNGGRTYRELDALLLSKGYKMENFEHKLVEE